MFGGTFGAFRSRGRHFFSESTALYRQISEIMALRNRYLALRRGRQYLREISGNGVNFGYPKAVGSRMKSVVAWSRILADQEFLCAINTDTEEEAVAYVTVDVRLHRTGDRLNVVYDSSGGKIKKEIKVEERNGKAVLVTIPPAGFAIFK